MKKAKGVTSILASALLFALSSVLAKYATSEGDAHAFHITMSRFVIGLILTIPLIMKDYGLVRPKNWFWVLARAVTNLISALLFFLGIQLSQVSTANLLNLTFPVFVFVLAPYVTREKNPWYQILLLVVTILGVWLVILPSGNVINGAAQSQTIGSIFAFGSAIFAGFSTIALRMSRRTDNSGTVVFYLMVVGLMVNSLLIIGRPVPSGSALWLTIAAGTAGAMGQFALTYGFSFVTAAMGSLLSTARICFAFLFGIILFSDSFSFVGIVGTVIISSSLILATLLGTRK